jgi:hypothetical protein
LKETHGKPKVSFEKDEMESQVENKSLNINETEKTNHKPISKEPISNKKINKKDEFEAFWILCPRKVGKGAASEKYWIAREEVSKEDLEIAMKAHARATKGKET